MDARPCTPRLRGRSKNILAAGALLLATPALADRGALSVDVGAGAAAMNLAAPYASTGTTTLLLDFQAVVGLRYALTNELEFTATVFFEPRVGYTFKNVAIQPPAPSEALQGSVAGSVYLWGVTGGVRYVTGLIWRLVAGLEVGWCQRVYSGIQFIQATNGQAIPLIGFSTGNLVLQPVLGVEWDFADHWSAALLPRFTVLVGPDATVGASLVLSFSYSWFL